MRVDAARQGTGQETDRATAAGGRRDKVFAIGAAHRVGHEAGAGETAGSG
jgi:hypothetical protein